MMTARLGQVVGLEKVAAYAQKFGVIDNMPLQYSMLLGAGETTPLKLTTGYAMIVNGGKKITPTFIDRVQDREGKNCDGSGNYRHHEPPRSRLSMQSHGTYALCTAGTRVSWSPQGRS